MAQATPSHFESFSFIKQKHIPSLNITVQEFEHKETGAQHIHMQSDSEENVFLVALRTVPEDSTGVAHILEHTALCGSKKYPVRDPFFMMTRRSLNTFMNAFTSSDWTAYPVASLNKKDFNNLLDVYLDAVFFSNLDPLDFAQEGHRLEFQDPKDSNTPLEFKGVVFNEMKGAMSSISSQLWHTLTKYLFPTSTYHFNSGGEPEDIPNLSYEQLVTFYKTHYHPSNAIFMTYGDIGAITHQEKFEKQVLSSFSRLNQTIAVTTEKRYFAPLKVQESYPNSDEDLSNKSHVVVSWLLGESANLDESLRAQLLSSVLLDNSACPLMYALESTELGSAPSPMCGLDDSQKELSFACGLAGTANSASDDVEELILDTLKEVSKNGIALEDIESALHQLELHQREVGGDSYPYGLQLILKSLTSANHRGDPASLLDLESALEKLRNDIKDPKFISKLIDNLLLNNMHRVRLTLVPDADMAERKNKAEVERLAKIKAGLNKEEKDSIIELSSKLKARQDKTDDPACLPKVTLEDVPEKENSVSGEISTVTNCKVTQYKSGTNGLIYQQSIYNMPKLDEKEMAHLSFYNHCVTELGAGKLDYLEMQKRQSAISGGVSGFNSVRGGVSDANALKALYIYSGKALSRNHENLSCLLNDIITGARFDEHSRIREIVAQIRVGMEQSITGNGHMLAMSAASAGISMPSQLSHKFSGLQAIQRVKQIDKSLDDKVGLQEFANILEGIHSKITQQEHQLLVIGEESVLTNSQGRYEQLCKQGKDSSSYSDQIFSASTIQQAWICNSQVNFCARAYPTVPVGHQDSAALVVLGGFLRNGYLHKTIREQGGAYGGGASQDNNGAAFRFYSYRDPRMAETLSDFDASLNWLLQTKHASAQLEEAILGTISSIDRSESPAGRAKRCFHAELHGRSLEVREAYRQSILNTTLDDLIRVCETYITPENANTAIVTGKAGLDQAKALNLDIIEL